MIITSLPIKIKKLKVLVCAYACLEESGVKVKGGEAVLGWNIVKQLARFHNIFVLTHSQNRLIIETALKRESLKNIKFYYLDLPSFLKFLQKFQGGIQLYAYLWQIKAYFFAKKLHQKFHFDVFHHVTYANDWMASFIGALLPIPYIRGPGGGANRTSNKFLSEYSFRHRLWERIRVLGQWILRHDPFFILGQERARAILVCNREVLEAIPQKWQNKAYLFPVNGISTRDLALISSTRIPTDKFRIFSAAKLIYWKGFTIAIRSFKAFTERCPEAEFTIIGDGPELPNLKALINKLNLKERVRFKKWMDRDRFLADMNLYDVFLYASLREGGGAVVVEAMAAGKPVICLDIGGPGLHVTDECGIRIKPFSPDQAIREMANALEKLYFDKKLRFQLGKAARERAEKEYHWDKLGEKLLKIYQKVLKI